MRSASVRRPAPCGSAARRSSASSASRSSSAQRAARPGDGPAIDQVVLKDLLDVMGQALTDLVHVYLEDAPRLIAALRAAAADESD